MMTRIRRHFADPTTRRIDRVSDRQLPSRRQDYAGRFRSLQRIYSAMTAFRFSLAILLCGFSVIVLPAQQPRPRGNGGPVQQPAREQRPQPQLNTAPVQRKPMDPDLRILLNAWGTSSAQIRELRGTHRRQVFDHVFQVEKGSVGHFYYVSPDKGRIDLEPTKPAANAKSKAKSKEGVPYALAADRAERWICTGKEVLTINDEAREYEVFPLPADLQGQNIINGPLPFLFGLKANEAEQRFDMELLDNGEATALILAKPLRADDQANYSEARILLNKTTFLPDAVRLLDPSGNRETRYWFDDLKPNDSGIRKVVQSLMGQNPFEPNLANYKAIQPPLVEQRRDAAPRESGLTPGPRNAILPVDGKGKVRFNN